MAEGDDRSTLDAEGDLLVLVVVTEVDADESRDCC